jgi:DNA polymerase III delta subunit
VKEKKQNSFAMADALVARDKKKAWVEYRRTVESGSAPEEIHGTIFWAMKMLYLCAHCDKDEAIKAGVSAYNYQRYLLNSKKYLGNELDDKLRELKNMYHDAHRGEGDLDALLEQFVLNA